MRSQDFSQCGNSTGKLSEILFATLGLPTFEGVAKSYYAGVSENSESLE